MSCNCTCMRASIAICPRKKDNKSLPSPLCLQYRWFGSNEDSACHHPLQTLLQLEWNGFGMQNSQSGQMKGRIRTIPYLDRFSGTQSVLIGLHFFDVDVAILCGLRPDKQWAKWAGDLKFQNRFEESVASRKCNCREPRIFSTLARAPSGHTLPIPFKGLWLLWWRHFFGLMAQPLFYLE